MKSSYIIAILATAQAALASPYLLQSRDEHHGIRCDTPRNCINWYNTGSAKCSSGYKRYHKVAKGYPDGSYCERTCTTQERTDCNAKLCRRDEQLCNTDPRNNGICGNALKWCDGPVSMNKSTCTSKKMGAQVTFDADKNLCIPNGKTADSRKASPVRLGPGDDFVASIYNHTVSGYRQMSCHSTDYANAKLLAQKAAEATGGCTTTYDDDEGNTGYGTLQMRCETPKDNWDNVDKVLRQACVATSFNGKKAYFNNLGFSGQP